MEPRRAAALGSVITTNVAMLVGFRHGAPWRRQHRGNRAFVVLLAGLMAACGLVLAWPPLSRQFGLPAAPMLQTLGWWLLAGGVAAAAAVAWRRLAAASPGA
jgi:hypothetical protein